VSLGAERDLLGDGHLIGGVFGGGTARASAGDRGVDPVNAALGGAGGAGGPALAALATGALGAGAVGAALGADANPTPLTSQQSSSTLMSLSLISQRAKSHNLPAWSSASVLASMLTWWQ